MKVTVIMMSVCVVGIDSSLLNFFSMLGNDMNIHFSNAWDTIKQFIKRPARHNRRFHREADEPTIIYEPATPPSHFNLPITVKYVTTTDITTKEYSIPPDVMYYFQRPTHKKVLLPIIEKPKWNAWGDWMDIQKLGFFNRGVNSLRSRGELTTVRHFNDEDSNKDDEEDLGVMIFI